MENKVRYLIPALLFSLAFLAESAGNAIKDDFNPELIAAQIKSLSSPDDVTVTQAIRAISLYGEKAVPTIASAADRANSSYRVNFIRTLAAIGGENAEKATAEILCNESNPKSVIKLGVFIKESWPDISRKQLVRIATDPAYSQKQRAMSAFFIKAVGDARCIDDILDIFEAFLVVGKSTNVGMDLNVTTREHVGDTNYSHDMSVNSGNKSMVIPVKMTMPIFKTSQAKTKIVVTAQSALEVITGQQFGQDIAKWRKWWSDNRDVFTNTKFPVDKKSENK